ncbi:MAG: hypothetical protein WBC44_11740 [Planctomycetaceae bacterium]
MRFSAQHGLGFRFATDGTRQFCVVFDTADGTPIMLSDERQSLFYDLSGNRIVLVPNSRTQVSVDWIAEDERPLKFEPSIHHASNPKDLPKHDSFFRLDKFVHTSSLISEDADSADGPQRYSAARDGGVVELIWVTRDDPTWFRFTSRKTGEDYIRLEMHADRIGSDIEDAAFAFPDVARLQQNLDVATLDAKDVNSHCRFLNSCRGCSAKMAIAIGDADQQPINKLLFLPDWEELRNRDADLGQRYRDALAKQGFHFAVIDGGHRQAMVNDD